MTNQSGGTPTEQKPAAERIEEARQLYETIGETLNAVLELVNAGDFKDIDLLPRQMSRLTDALADVRKKEADFNDKFGTGLEQGEIGLVALTFQSLNSFMRPFAQMPRDFCHPAMNGGGADCRTH